MKELFGSNQEADNLTEIGGFDYDARIKEVGERYDRLIADPANWRNVKKLRQDMEREIRELNVRIQDVLDKKHDPF